jgi:hypothetical protein
MPHSLIDVINDFEFEGCGALLDLAIPVGKNIARLKKNDPLPTWKTCSE